MSALHLAKRFVTSLWPVGPSTTDTQWAIGYLNADEADLWNQMSRADRRHSIAVAKRVRQEMPNADHSVMAAALLHDVGKLASGLGTYGRVVATLSAKVAGYDMADQWSQASGFTRKVGLYLRHDELGADMLRMAGSAPLTIKWAAEHHFPASEWTIDPEVGTVLKEADDD